MAYKFQLGAARLSGSLVQEGSVHVSGGVDTALTASQIALIDASGLAGTGLEDDTNGKLRTNFDGLSALGGTGLHQTQDSFPFSDNGTDKRITFSNLEDAIFANVSGDATIAAGGALTIAATSVENGMLAGSIANAKLANSTISGIGLGGNLNSLSKATNSGLALTSYNGSSPVSDLAVDIDDLAAVTTIASGDTFAMAQQGESGDPTKKITFDNMAAKLAGNGLAAASGVLAVGVDDSSIELDSDAVRVKALGVTNAMLAGSIANAKLSNSAVTVTAGDGLKGGGSVSLGGSVTLNVDVDVMAGVGLTADNDNEELDVSAVQTGITSITNASLVVGRDTDNKVDFSEDNIVKFFSNGSERLRLTDTGNTVVKGNLLVEGTTTTIDSTTINISSSFTFEGPADDHETKLDAGTPVADTTVELPQLGAGTYFLPALTNDPGTTAITATAAELNLVDGGATVGTTALASGDGFLHNDGGTMKQTSIDKLADFFAGDGLKSSSGVMALDIGELSALDGTGVEDTDAFLFRDGSTEKKIVFSNLYGAIFGQMTGGQATVNAGGDISLAVSSITAQTEMTGDVADADELMISDGGVLKRLDFSVLRDAVFNDVSGDATIADGGALTIAATSVENGMLAGSIADSKLNQISTAGKVALSALEIDGASEIGAALEATDLIIVDDGAGGTNRSATIQRVATFVGTNLAAQVQNVDDGGTLKVGVNYFSNHGGAESATLPASPSVGQSVKIKAGSDCSVTNSVTINRAGSQTIDGVQSIILESPFAAIELIYVDDTSKLWRVF